MHALVNATVFTGDAELEGAAVLIDAGRIVALVPAGEQPRSACVEDLGGGLLAPGFIDLQVNGGGGVLFNATPTVEAIRRIAAAHRRFGTTGFLPTVISDRLAVRQAAVAAVRGAIAAGVPGVLGIHLEGPHIAPSRRGVHDASVLGPAGEADMAVMTADTGGRTLVTLAPEVAGPELVGRLAAAGVRLAAGHSAATYDEAMAGFAAGIGGVTHLYNAMSPLATREPGLVGAALDRDGVWCGIIIDGHHVHDAAVRLAWRAKPPGGLILVTDAMPPVGAAGPFTLYGDAITVADGRCTTADGRLAGSALDMASAVRNAVRRIGIPIAEALRMASTYPAAALGIDGERGRIAPGMIADLVHLAPALVARATWIGGNRQSC